jgi:hypothetical protein
MQPGIAAAYTGRDPGSLDAPPGTRRAAGLDAPRGSVEPHLFGTYLDLSRGLMAAASAPGRPVLDLDFSPGYDGGPAVGPGGRGSTRPRDFLPCSLERVLAGQVGCGMAWMRCQAVTTGSAQGQFPAILRSLRRPPRTRRAAACRTQRLRLRFRKVAVQGRQLQPGQQAAHRGDPPVHRRRRRPAPGAEPDHRLACGARRALLPVQVNARDPRCARNRLTGSPSGPHPSTR